MSEEPTPVGRFDWERLVDRAEMPAHLKATAYVLAHHANNDGTNVRIGRERLADILDTSKQTAGVNREALVAMGWLQLVRRGGGRGGDGTTSVYRLTDPGLGALIFRLDPDGNRLIERKVGKRPPRPIEVKPTSPQSPVDNSDADGLALRNEVKPTSPENDFQVKPTSDSGQAHLSLPLLTTNTLPLPVGDQRQFAATRPVDNPKRVNGTDPVRAPPLAAAPKPRTQPRKRRKR